MLKSSHACKNFKNTRDLIVKVVNYTENNFPSNVRINSAG